MVWISSVRYSSTTPERARASPSSSSSRARRNSASRAALTLASRAACSCSACCCFAAAASALRASPVCASSSASARFLPRAPLPPAPACAAALGLRASASASASACAFRLRLEHGRIRLGCDLRLGLRFRLGSGTGSGLGGGGLLHRCTLARARGSACQPSPTTAGLRNGRRCPRSRAAAAADPCAIAWRRSREHHHEQAMQRWPTRSRAAGCRSRRAGIAQRDPVRARRDTGSVTNPTFFAPACCSSTMPSTTRPYGTALSALTSTGRSGSRRSAALATSSSCVGVQRPAWDRRG